ncbi:MAG TPA: response regulator, partial [Polyangiales bacterium]
RQVLTNLIGNAVKFTDEGQIEVAVSLTTDSGVQQLLFEVADSGIGIAPERQRHIFDAFQQADNSTTRRYGGTGLGLTICKELVAAMGGKMGLVSSKGHGSTFSFTLPLEVKVTIRSLPTQTILVGRTVLLIEDHPLARSSLKNMLEHHGAEVLAAADLEQAQALLGRFPDTIHVALIDDTLPAQECRELPALLKRMPACRAARFVMLRSRERLGRAALGAAGFDFALDKPLLSGDLENALSAPLDETPTTRRFAALPTRDVLSGPRALDVLIVEDHPVNAHFLSSLLRRSGHRVVHASNGVRALSAVSGQLFDIILMDVQMPEMDGLEATRRIREAERGGERRTPIVALTANAMKGDEQECLAAGMDAYIAKPIDPDLLRKTLSRLTVPSVPPSVDSAGTAPAQPVRAAEPARPTAPPFARDALLERACGDPRFEADLIRIFVDTQEEMVRDVDNSVESGDLNAIRHAAHRLKGALLLVCAGPAAALALELEKAAREGQREPMPELLRGLKREMIRLRSALGDVVGGGSS